MSIATIVTRGFGSFGDIGHVVTAGYDTGVTVVPNEPGLEFTLPANRLHFTMPANLLQYTLPANRLHYKIPGEG